MITKHDSCFCENYTNIYLLICIYIINRVTDDDILRRNKLILLMFSPIFLCGKILLENKKDIVFTPIDEMALK